MTHRFQAVVWIDCREALDFELGQEEVIGRHILAASHDGHLHQKSGTVGFGHSHNGKACLTEISDALFDNREVEIVGDGMAKTELAPYIRDDSPAAAPRTMGVEKLGQTSLDQIVAFARKFFGNQDYTTPPH